MIHVHTILNSILNSCTYILYNESKDVYLIDCGDIEPIKEFIQAKGKTIKGIFLTHCHYDHIYGINDVISIFPDVAIYGSKDTITGLKDIRINLSKYHGLPLVVNEKAILKEISEISQLNILEEKIKVLETPGHDTGCLSYLIGNKLFTGDSYIPNLPVFTKWKRSDRIKGLRHEEWLKSLKESFNLTFYPGHLIYITKNIP